MAENEKHKIEDMTETELQEVIKTAPFVIGLLENPSDNLQMVAMTQDKGVFNLIDNPCVEVELLRA